MTLPTPGPITDSTTAHPELAGSVESDRENEALLQYVQRSVNEDEDFAFMRFESLQRTNIVALQVKLVRLKGQLRMENIVSDSTLEDLRQTLEHYGQSLPSRNNLISAH